MVFKALALAVVDEQHRFGVRERLALTAKGEAVDVLVLSATPIPRTLVLTYFGDMDVSELREKPLAGNPSIPARCRAADSTRCSTRVGRALEAASWSTGSARWSRNPNEVEHLTDATSVREPAAAFRRQGRPGPWPDARSREGSRDGAVRRR